MKAPIRRSRRRPEPGWKRWVDQANAGPIPWLWMVTTLFLYAAAGLILGAFPVPYWVWTLGLVAVLVQAIALAGGRTLSKFRWLPATVLALLGILGAALLTITLSVSLNFAGAADLADLSPQQVVFEVIQFSLLALVISALCAGVTAETGDALGVNFNRPQATLILAAICILGLGLGGLVGLLIAKP